MRALNLEPGTFTEIRKQDAPSHPSVLKIIEVSLIHLLPPHSPAVFIESQGKLVARARDGMLVLEKVQPQGGKAMSGQDFLRGNHWILEAGIK